MADIQPFRGLRPRPELVQRVASPPYDVLNSEEARQMAADNPMSFLRVVKAEIDLPPGADVHGDDVYLKGADNLRRMVVEQVLIQDPAPCFYVYELTMGTHVQRGVMLGASAAEYEQGLIKKHEFTRRDKEDDRAHHVDVLGANTGPVMLTYRALDAIDGLLARVCANLDPVYDFVAPDGIGHRMWAVCDQADVAALQRAFLDVDALYIADGHHRSAAGHRVRNLRRDRNPNHDGSEAYNYYLAVAFPDNQLQIMGYYRAVTDLAGMTPEAFITRVQERFEVVETDEPVPRGLHQFTMFLEGKWYCLTALPDTYPESDPVKRLDCSILQENLLAPVLGIKDPRSDERIDFIGGIRGTRELERRCGLDMKIAFALYPVTVAQLIAIADAGAVMPPKSTWFEPKLRSGMVTRSLDDQEQEVGRC